MIKKPLLLLFSIFSRKIFKKNKRFDKFLHFGQKLKINFSNNIKFEPKIKV